ncbi:hypothetical protein PG989_013837 [Apiospora arundinis]
MTEASSGAFVAHHCPHTMIVYSSQPPPHMCINTLPSCRRSKYVYDCWHSVPAQEDARSLLNDAHGLNNVQNLRIKAIPEDPGPEHGLEMKILCDSFGNDRVIPVPNLYLLVSSVGGGQLIDITTQNAEGEPTTVYILKQSTVYTPAPLEFTPLSDRGWIYQERILSPRTLHFTPAQLVWECRRMYRMEDLMRTPYSDEISPTTSALLGKTYLASAGDLLDVWQSEIVQRDYSGRVFIKSEDKLIAIAGIAHIMHQHLGCAYVAGLWEDHLAHGLGFWLTGPIKLGPAPRRPTWAWSSHDKRVMWWGVNNNFRPDPHFRFVKECLEYAGDASNPFNPVRGGFITIEAAPVSFTIPHPPASDFSPLKLSMGEFEGKCRIDYPWLFREMGDFPRRLEGILLGHTNVEAVSFLLVVEPDQSRGGYRHIGYAHIYFPDQDERDTFWLTKTQFQQTWSIY